ncbi:MAG: glutathione S-transferase family protein [Reyranella sp.]|nr:glutathione S-transferase family protein [Reyranella sp.]MDP3162803.1 glutathione S-transferase family protein [Reyranella sp.]
MTKLKIHGMAQSTFTRTVRLACHEKGIDYELVTAMPGEVGAVNPFGKIPVMVQDDFTLYESLAIVRYLDRTFAGPRLWPDEARQAAICDQWISAVCDSLVGSALHYLAARFGFFALPEEMVTRHLERTRALVPIFDRQLGRSRYLAGDHMTAADLFLAPIFLYFPGLPELKSIAEAAPNCTRWARDMGARPSIKATDSEQKPQLAA